MAKSRSKVPLAPHAAGLNNPFAALGNLQVPAAEQAAPPPAAPIDDHAVPLLATQGKLIVRHERKGRGGKTVTLIEGLELTPAGLDELARQARKAMGCGASVEDGVVVLQGDQRGRTGEFLTGLGAKLCRIAK